MTDRLNGEAQNRRVGWVAAVSLLTILSFRPLAFGQTNGGCEGWHRGAAAITGSSEISQENAEDDWAINAADHCSGFCTTFNIDCPRSCGPPVHGKAFHHTKLGCGSQGDIFVCQATVTACRCRCR